MIAALHKTNPKILYPACPAADLKTVAAGFCGSNEIPCQTIPNADGPLAQLVFIDDDNFMSVNSPTGDGIVRVWHLADGKCIRTVLEASQVAGTIVLSPDGRTLAEEQGRGLKLSRVNAESPKAETHRNVKQSCLAYSPDGVIIQCKSDQAPIPIEF